MSFNKKISFLFPYLIVFIAITVNVLMWQRYFQPQNSLSGDASYYNTIAKTISQGKTTTPNGSDIGAVILPGYPAIVGLVYSFFGQKVSFIYTLQIVVSIIACLLTYFFMKKQTNSLIGFILTLWVLCYYPLWQNSIYILKESLTASFLLISLYFFHKYYLKYKLTDFIIFTIFWLFIILIMNRFVAHFVFVSIFLLFLYSRTKLSLNKFLIYAGTIALIIGLWHIRQYVEYDQIVIFGPNRLEMKNFQNENNNNFHSYERYKKMILNSGFSNARKKHFQKSFSREKFNEMKQNYEAFEGFEKYWSRIKGFFEIYNTELRFGFGGDIRITPPPSKIRKYTNLIFLSPMFIFMFVGLYFSIKNKNYFFILVFICIMAHILLHTYVHYIHRYRLTILPAIYIMGWYGIYHTFLVTKNFLENHNFTKRKKITNSLNK